VPSCVDLEPNVALAGAAVNVYGTNFGRWTNMVTVTVGGVAAEVLAVNPNQITFKVPAGVALGPQPLEIATPKGAVTCERTLGIVADTAFCPDGLNDPGKGFR